MSIELPEAQILAKQMNETLKKKKVTSYDLRDIDQRIKIGFIKDVDFFKNLINKKVLEVTSRGNAILIKLNKGMNLLIGLEYGGVIRYHIKGDKIPKYHLRIDFTDESTLIIRIKSMGLITAISDKNLDQSYIYKRDFLGGISPVSKEFTFENFFMLIHRKKNRLSHS